MKCQNSKQEQEMKSKEKEPEHAWPSHRESPQRGLCESHGTLLHPSTASRYLREFNDQNKSFN